MTTIIDDFEHFEENSIARGFKPHEFSNLETDVKSKLIKLMARISEKSYRRGLQHGSLGIAIVDPAELRFNVSPDYSPFTDVADENGNWVNDKQSAIDRLKMEYGVLRDIGLSECPLDRLVIPHGGFRTIVADPPWQYGAWGKNSGRGCRGDFSGWKDVIVEMPYPTMTVQDIAALPIADCAADNCDLYLWTTQKYLPDAFKVLAAWGFKYCQTLTWCKTPRGTGQGGLFCPTTEFLILGRKGKMPKKTRIDSTWWNVKRPHNSHSTKPEFFQDLIESVSDGPRLEMFARRPRDGWVVWGNEV